MSFRNQHSPATAKLDSWIVEALAEDDNGEESAVHARLRTSSPPEGAEPIEPSSMAPPPMMPPSARPSAVSPADLDELSGLLEGEDLSTVRRK